MATTGGKKNKKNKGKTVPLTDFLATNKGLWSDEVEENDRVSEFSAKPVLPAAPRAARVADIDERIPNNPPFVAYLSSLAYEVEESDIQEFFKELNVANIRLPRDERNGRLKGFGYVEFGDRASFISALRTFETTIKGRRIKIDVAENNENERRRGNQRENRERESNYDPEKTAGDWRSGPRSDFSSVDDRRGGGLSSNNRRDYGGFRDRERGDRDTNDRGRYSGERETSSWRDNNDRRGFSDRGGDRDRDRENRNNYGNRRNYEERDSAPPPPPSEPRTRRKLNLQPRTLPIEEVKNDPPPKEVKKEEEPERAEPERPSAPPAASIFGQAKPVDTAAREREIEERLAREKEVAKVEKEPERPRIRNEGGDAHPETKKLEPAPEPKENVWVRRSQRTDAQSVSASVKEVKDEKATNNGRTTPAEDAPESNQETEKEVTQEKETETEASQSRKNEDENERSSDNDNRYNRFTRNYNDRNRENDRFRRDDRDRRDKDRKDYDRRDRPYDSEKREGRHREERDRDGDRDNRRFNSDRDNDGRRHSDRDGDRKCNNDRDGESRRHNDREAGRHKDQDDHGRARNEKRGPADKGARPGKGTQDRDRVPQKDNKPKEPRKTSDEPRMPKYKEVEAPNYVATNKYSFLQEDGASE